MLPTVWIGLLSRISSSQAYLLPIKILIKLPNLYPQQEGSGYMKNYTADMTTFFDPTGKQPTDMQFYFGPNHFKTLLNSNDLSLSQKIWNWKTWFIWAGPLSAG